MTAGSGRVGYKGHILEGHAPFERTVRLADLEPGVHRVEGTYERTRRRLDLGRGVSITGEGPFTGELDGDAIRIHVEGRARVLNVSQPEFIRRPQYWIDGVEWMACWTDWPASGFGSWSNTDMVALTVPDGTHDLEVRDMTFPAGWERTFSPTIEAAVVDRVSQ